MEMKDSLTQAVESMLRMKLDGKLEAGPADRMRQLSALYSPGSEIGRGHFGVVRSCTEKDTGRRFACKTMLKASVQKEQDLQELCSEVLTMAHLKQHCSLPAGTVLLHDVIEDDSAFHLIMDYCQGGDLFDHVARNKRLSERETAQIVRQLALALQSMHNAGVIHRDVKPENVLLCEPPRERGASWKLKVADFGLCVRIKAGQKAKGVAGSPFYMAPEVVLGRDYGQEVDVWSLGVLMYTCLAGTLPFYGRSHGEIFSAVCRGTLDFAKRPWPLVSYEAKTLICLMLDRDANRRIRLSEVLNHPWVQRHCPEAAADRKPCSFFTKALNGISGACRSTAGGKIARSPSQSTSSHPAPLTAHTVGESALSVYVQRVSTTDDCRAQCPLSAEKCQESCASGASALTGQSSFAIDMASPASSAGNSTAEHVTHADAKVGADMPRHKVPGGSRKGFSAPLTRPE